MAQIVVTHYRYRPPQKKPKKLAVAVEVPTIVTAKKPGEAQTPQVAVSVSRKRARLIAAASEAEPSEVANDAATMRAMEAIARTQGIKTKGV